MPNNNIIISDLKLNSYFLIKKSKRPVKSLHLQILCEDAKLKSIWAPSLTPLIGKDKINEFCPLFNKESINYYHNDVYIPVFFLLYKNKTYSFIFRIPSLFFVLKYLFDLDKVFNTNKLKSKFKYKKIYYITVEELYLILNIKYNSYITFTDKIYFINMIKSIYKFNIKIIY